VMASLACSGAPFLIALGTGTPLGWQLCDGSAWPVPNEDLATPDPRDRFPIGSGGSYSVGETGGSKLTDHRHAKDAASKDADEFYRNLDSASK